MTKSRLHKKDKVVLAMLVVILVLLVVFFVGLLSQASRQHQHWRQQEANFESKLAQARKEFDRKEAYLVRLLEDPEFLQRVARERLGYARPDELLFRFTDE